MKTKFKNIVWGIILVLIAVGLIANKMGAEMPKMLAGLSIAQILLGIAFLGILVDALAERSFGGIFFSVAFLGIVFARQLEIQNLVPWTLLLAALLLTIAFDMIFPKKSKGGHDKHMVSGEASGEYIYEMTRLGGVTKYIRSDNFKGGEFVARFAGMELYFDKVQVPEGKATIEIQSSFAGVELYVPKEWKIINNMSSMAGAVDESGAPWTGDEDVEITLVGSNKFGGVEITRI